MASGAGGSGLAVLGTALTGSRTHPAISCRGGGSGRLRAALASQRRRQWIIGSGQATPATPVWLSREGWLTGVRGWALSEDFGAVCARVGVAMSAATVVAIARRWADFADHRNGRNAAVTRASLAAAVGCAPRTITRAWRVLGAGGWAVEAARGHGSARTHPTGRRPSIWHLITPKPAPAAVHNPAGPVGNVHLPPKGGLCSVPSVSQYSPRTRAAAPALPRDTHSTGPRNTPAPRPRRARRQRRATPRPLALQRLAAQLVLRCHGLHRTHIGAICDALANTGIDPAIWSCTQLQAALDADMRATGRTWPDHIRNPAAFLASRLRCVAARGRT